MKRLSTLILAAVMSFPVLAQYIEVVDKKQANNAPLAEFVKDRSLLFNFDWRFQLGMAEGAERPDYDDSAWRKIDLPHDFQFEMPWVESENKGRGFKQMSEGWYRKTFRVPDSYKGKRITLDFGGIIFYGDVYVNGKKVASTDYGYVGFEADITSRVKFGEDNVVAVYSHTGPVNGSRWYTGGGIFRDVYLRASNQTRVTRHGLYITAKPVGAKSALSLYTENNKNPEVLNAHGDWEVNVQMQIQSWQKHNCSLRAVVKDEKGQVVGTTECGMPDHTIQNCTEVDLPAVKVSRPALWSPDTPTLYSVEAVLLEDGVVIDSVADNFGFRTLEYNPAYGFKLNGKKFFIKGMANHHDLGALGAAAFDKAVERQMRMIKDFGYNCIRCSHNPYSEAFCRIADRVGLVIVDELIDKWSDKDYWGGRRPFMTLWPELITEWVRRDRNRPSVVMWSLGNELQTRSDWSGYQTNDWGITTYRIFDQMLKRYDSTRPTTVAMFPARAGAQRNTPDFKQYLVPPELACVTEISSFNYQWDAYHGYFDFKPDMILFQSEAVTNQLQQPYFGMDYDRCVGMAYWGAIEYWGESSGWPKKGWNYSFFNHTLEPYPQAYLIKSAFEEDKPVVRIGVIEGKGESLEWNDVKVGQQRISRNWNYSEGTKQNVYTYTNADEVELFCNGRSLGVQKNDRSDVAKRNIIMWSGIEYGKGGKLVAVARKGGKEIARDEVETTGKAVALKLVLESANPMEAANAKTLSWKADGMDLQYVKVYAVDAKGRVVPDAKDEVTVSVSGAATLMTVDNGDHYTDDIFLDRPTRKMVTGFAQAIVRSQQKPGAVTITASSPTLRAASVKVRTVE